MKFLVRWLFRLFILALVLVVALVLLKDVLAKGLTEYQIRKQTGMDVNIGSMEVGLLSPTLTVEDLKVFNRAEFGGSPFLEMPDLHLEYDVAALARRRVHLFLARISLSQVNIVEAKDGRTNLVLALEYLNPPPPSPTADPGSLLGFTFAGIDTLNLTLGRVKYTSLRRPENTTEVTVGLKNGIFTNVKSVPQLRSLVLNSMFQNGITITQPSDRRRSVVPAEPTRPKAKRGRVVSPTAGSNR